MKKKLASTLLVTASLAGVALFTNAEETHAHGYVSSPPSRAEHARAYKAATDWNTAFKEYGGIIDNPQALEWYAGFPEKGPDDGQIASAQTTINGQVDASMLNEQSETRWIKTDITTGANTFEWTYTAPHSTEKWEYWMTTPDWDPNAPLTRDTLERLVRIDHDLTNADQYGNGHTIDIPEDREGYHVVLAIWETDNHSFYNVIDVNVLNENVAPVAPSAPKNVQVTDVTRNGATIDWDGQASASTYNVFRDGVLVSTVRDSQFIDVNLESGQTYNYEIQAVSSTNQLSAKSEAISVTTLTDDVEVNPTAPKHLHSMGETTDEISLMWGASTHPDGIKLYEIYRDGVKVGETKMRHFDDKNLEADTEYSYTIVAVSNDGNKSEESNTLVVSTEKAEEIVTPPTDGGEGEVTPPTDGGDGEDGESEVTPPTGDMRVFKVGTFTNPEMYTANEVVYYEGKEYVVIQTHPNYGDASWNPADAATLFRLK